MNLHPVQWEIFWAWFYDLLLEARGGVDTFPHPIDDLLEEIHCRQGTE